MNSRDKNVFAAHSEFFSAQKDVGSGQIFPVYLNNSAVCHVMLRLLVLPLGFW